MARLNVQGLARKDKGLLSTILCDPGNILVSEDFSAGEPTVTTHFSGDTNYRWACFDGVGKAPEYRNGVLMIDDIYLMCMSVSPIGRDKMREAFNMKWGGLSFQDQWLKDPEVIKSFLKAERQFHKILALGLGYGMGAKKMVNSAYEKGYLLDFQTAKRFHAAYWQLFSGVKRLADNLAAKVERDGWLLNPFGYRLTPEPRKAFNYFIQSSVSGAIHLYGAQLKAYAPYANIITCIHDEFLIECPEACVEELRHDSQLATDALNRGLGWSVNIRTGFAPGKDWYSAK